MSDTLTTPLPTRERDSARHEPAAAAEIAPPETPVSIVQEDAGEANADAAIEEISGIVVRRFAQAARPDRQLCRFAGLLPEIEAAKRRPGLVREARIVARYLDRDDVDPKTAQQIVDELAGKLRRTGAVPALYTIYGLSCFLLVLVAVGAALSWWWQTSGWSAEAAGYAIANPRVITYPGFSIFNVSPWLVIAVAVAGGLGSVVSMLTRLQSFGAATDTRLLFWMGATRPLIGIAFGLFVGAALQSRLFPFPFPSGPSGNFAYVAIAFIAGFSERLPRGVIGFVERRASGPKSRGGTPPDSRRTEPPVSG